LRVYNQWVTGTLCITIAANIAETGILDFDSCFPDSIIGFVADPSKSNVHYVEYLLTSFKTMLQAKGKGSAQGNINLATFENERFPFPSLPDQNAIVAKLDELSTETKNLEAIYQQKLMALDELKKSILNQALAGKLC
jgi:type I restriction enzyme S subunit